MSSTRLSTLIDEFPEESGALARFESLLAPSPTRPAVREYDSARLYDLLKPSNQRVLVKMLSSAADKGLIRRIVRVVSDAAGGIGDYDSLLSLPSTLFDEYVGKEVEVTLDRVKLVYEVTAQSD